MAGGKASPRQKMINLMYLVFIAMLAMQIGTEVLRSFENVNNSLTDSNNLTDKNNDSFYKLIEDKAAKEEEYKEVLTSVDGLNEQSNALVSVIEKIKKELDAKVGYSVTKDGAEVNYSSLSNVDAITGLLFKDETKPTALGNELTTKIGEYNSYLKELSTISPKSNALTYLIETKEVKKDGGKQSWLNDKFYGQPMIAAKTNLSELQSRVKTAQGNIMRTFLTSKLLKDIEINEFKAIISNPGFVTKGSSVQTFAALGAFDNRLKGTATVNGRKYPLVDGKATIPIDASSSGVKNLSGTMSFVDSKGQSKTVPLETMTYEVVDAVIAKVSPQFSGVITADKMNVLYIGVDNPVSASVSGVQQNTIKLSGPGLRSTGSGKGIVKPTSRGTVSLTVSGTTPDGKNVSTSSKFRVKGLPKPEAVVRGKSMTKMPASSLPNQKVTARMPDDFAFDVQVTVTGFSVKVPGKPAQKVNGNSLSAASSVKSAKRGSTVTIFDIKSVASGGIPLRTSNNVAIEVK